MGLSTETRCVDSQQQSGKSKSQTAVNLFPHGLKARLGAGSADGERGKTLKLTPK
tara:strand:- start:128 stop:292 length:165 start_codon:yes stop_codon:yes gene_type:complete